MSTRIPALGREDYRPDQQKFYEDFIEQVKKKAPHPGGADRASKTLFPVLAVIPDVGRLSVDMLDRLEDATPELPPHARETAALYTNDILQIDLRDNHPQATGCQARTAYANADGRNHSGTEAK